MHQQWDKERATWSDTQAFVVKPAVVPGTVIIINFSARGFKDKVCHVCATSITKQTFTFKKKIKHLQVYSDSWTQDYRDQIC